MCVLALILADVFDGILLKVAFTDRVLIQLDFSDTTRMISIKYIIHTLYLTVSGNKAGDLNKPNAPATVERNCMEFQHS